MASKKSAFALPGLANDVKNLSLQDSFTYLRGNRNGRLNIVAIGKTGEGKSATLNAMIMYASDPKPKEFREEESPDSVTKAFDQCSINLFGLNCRLIDTMGLFDTETTPERKAELQFLKIPDLEEEHKVVLVNLANVISLCSDGIDAFLLVVDGTRRMSFETKETINVIQRFLGAAMLDHCIFALTRADEAKEGTMKMMEDSIRRYLTEIGYTGIEDRFVHFDNKNRPKHQVAGLLKTIEDNLKKRNGCPYTHIAFQHAQNVLDDEKKKLRIELETELQRRIEMETDKIRVIYEQRMQAIQIQLDEKTLQINNLREEADEERSKLQNDIKTLNKQIVDLDRRKGQEIQRAVQNATSKCNEDYLNKFRQMENTFQEQHKLLVQNNQNVINDLRKQITDLASRPTTVHHHHHKSGGCFAGDCLVDTPNGKLAMSDLKIGDFVLSADNQGKFEYVPLLMWMQADPDDAMEFLRIETKGGNVLVLTKNHKLFKFNSKDIQKVFDVDADDVVPGDLLLICEQQKTAPIEVVKVSAENKLGIYAPLTSSGRIVVNGLLCSCYVRISTGYILYSHNTAHSICAPMRWFCMVNKENLVVSFMAKNYLYGLISFNRFLTRVVAVKDKFLTH